MRETIRPTLVLLVLFTSLTGLGYPLVTTGLAQLLFPVQANGSLVVVGGAVRGSTLVGQSFSGAAYLLGRPSATGPVPYNAAASAGSQLGPTSAVLDSLVRARVAEVRTREGLPDSVHVPADLVTASGSGLDPHVSVASAELQVARLARQRGIAPDSVRRLITRASLPRGFGVVGEPRVNVLLVNLLLDGVIADVPSYR